MPPTSIQTLPLNKRALTTLISAVGLMLLLYISFHHTSSSPLPPSPPPTTALTTPPDPSIPIDPQILRGSVISSTITNATLKAELGRAGWKLLHTTMAKFPEKPSAEDQSALSSFVYLFARLYPCGECAGHFQKILERFPPQVGSRNSAAAWACHVHNVVNRSLEKEEFDCNDIGSWYDCGCGDDTRDKKEDGGKKRSGKIDLVVERNGLTAGG